MIDSMNTRETSWTIYRREFERDNKTSCVLAATNRHSKEGERCPSCCQVNAKYISPTVTCSTTSINCTVGDVYAVVPTSRVNVAIKKKKNQLTSTNPEHQI